MAVPPRVVLDTNTIISYVLTRGPTLRELFAQWRAGRFLYLATPAMLDEIADVLARPRIRERAVEDVDVVSALAAAAAERVPGETVVVGACRDPKDDKFLACAVEGRADYLVTGDADLLDLGAYQGVEIVTPRRFLELLESASPPTD